MCRVSGAVLYIDFSFDPSSVNVVDLSYVRDCFVICLVLLLTLIYQYFVAVRLMLLNIGK